MCNAVRALSRINNTEDKAMKSELIREYAKELDLIDYEISAELQELGEKVIAKMPELSLINEYDIKVGYVLSYEAKRDKGKSTNADCRKVTGPYKAFLPFDFVITFYDPNISHMSDNQKKVLMLHELKHIGIGDKGLRIENHDVEDFMSILETHGIKWNDNGEDVADILGGDKDI